MHRDVLINNAGLSAIPDRADTVDGNEQIFQVNYLGHFLLTNLLMPSLAKAAAPRVISVSSRASFNPDAKLSIGETDNLQHAGAAYNTCNTPTDCPSYSASKLEQLLFTRELQRRLGGESSRAVVMSVHPGLVKTELFRYSTIGARAATRTQRFQAVSSGFTRYLAPRAQTSDAPRFRLNLLFASLWPSCNSGAGGGALLLLLSQRGRARRPRRRAPRQLLGVQDA